MSLPLFTVKVIYELDLLLTLREKKNVGQLREQVRVSLKWASILDFQLYRQIEINIVFSYVTNSYSYTPIENERLRAIHKKRASMSILHAYINNLSKTILFCFFIRQYFMFYFCLSTFFLLRQSHFTSFAYFVCYLYILFLLLLLLFRYVCVIIYVSLCPIKSCLCLS